MTDHPPAPPPIGERAVEAAILSLVNAAGLGKSITPEDAARALALDWQTKLSAVRRASVRLAQAGMIDILRKGKPVDPSAAKGVIRLTLPQPKPQD
jgi:hypothetical protein